MKQTYFLVWRLIFQHIDLGGCMKARLCDRQRNIAESENLTTHLPLLERGLSDEVVLWSHAPHKIGTLR